MEINKKIRDTIAEKIAEDIIEEILSWLPVKSLLKFRCVSKSWRSLIGSKRFIKTHLKNSSTTSNLKRHGIITSTYGSYNHKLQYYSLHSLLHKHAIHSIDFNYPYIYPRHSVDIVGSCNGLVCLLINRKKFILWNPSTRKSRKLPDVLDADQSKHEFAFDVEKYGFGFAESDDNCKVLGVLFVMNRRIGVLERVAKLYSLKSNSWKRIETCKTCATFDDSGTFVNGKLYWGRKPFKHHYGFDMDFFDLDNEVYGKIEHPHPQGIVKDTFHTTLGVLGGYLCVLCSLYGVKRDIWVLKQESWSKVFSISYNDCPLQDRFDTKLCTGVNGEIVLSCGSTFIVYNLKDRLYRLHEISYPCDFEEVNTYVESLVSI
ncbi:hypothetical protein BUALT_Bualt06G0012700 [Buddleja alternifolia]|uniref:F-box domain-containing protein n=1 Tax=Buddleja alternifolia TaxID=168488 RepID=A0AAV6XIJ4_9LAMI|nr:hypothetical protein BUALT_Bualt06G0012700 [Buddleja alternifolia]